MWYPRPRSNRITVDSILACILSNGWPASNSNIAVQGLLGCGEHGCLGLFERHEYKVVGSSNRFILYLGRWAKSYKHYICSPYLLIWWCRRCSRSQTRIVSESNRGSIQEGNIVKAINGDTTITTEKPWSRTNNKATRDNVIRYGSTVERGY